MNLTPYLKSNENAIYYVNVFMFRFSVNIVFVLVCFLADYRALCQGRSMTGVMN